MRVLRRIGGSAAARLTVATALLVGVLAGSPQQVAADPAPPPPVRTVSYNACGAHTCQNTVDSADTWAAKFESRMNAEGGPADVIALQEMCTGQYEALRKVLVATPRTG